MKKTILIIIPTKLTILALMAIVALPVAHAEIEHKAFYYYPSHHMSTTPPSAGVPASVETGTEFQFDSDKMTGDYIVCKDPEEIVTTLYLSAAEDNTSVNLEVSLYKGMYQWDPRLDSTATATSSVSPKFPVLVFLAGVAVGIIVGALVTKKEIKMSLHIPCPANDWSFFHITIKPRSPALSLWYGNSSYPSGTTIPMTTLVGGIAIPVGKLALVAPYIGLASTLMVAMVATTVCVRRVKSRKE